MNSKIGGLLLLVVAFVAIALAVHGMPPSLRVSYPTPSEELVLLNHSQIMTIILGEELLSDPGWGLAWSHKELGWPKRLLGFSSDAYWHDWGHDGELNGCGSHVTMIWAFSKNGYEYFLHWVEFKRAWERANGQAFNCYVMFANECDRPDQCAAPIPEVASLYLAIVDECPNCKIIGPGYSTADDGTLVRAFHDETRSQVGCPPNPLPCEAIDRHLHAHNQHNFPRPSLNLPPTGRAQIFCDRVYGEPFDGVMTPCEKPIWVTMGWRTCYPLVREGFRMWVEDARTSMPFPIEQVLVFTTYQDNSPNCHFNALLDIDLVGDPNYPTHVPTDMGEGWLDVWQNQGYP